MAQDVPAQPSAAEAPADAGPGQAAGLERKRYGQILKSSALIGSAAAVNVLIGTVRVKATAVFLGPAGVGLLGTLVSIADLARSVSELGINSSGVRQIAAAEGSGDRQQIARTIAVLRRTALALGLLGALLLVLFSAQVSRLSFGSEQYAGAVALLSVAVFFGVVSGGQAALIQGTRRIGDLARIGVWNGVLGSAVSVGILYVLGERGIALSLVCGAAVAVALYWRYSRRIEVPATTLTLGEIRRETLSLLKLGIAFMASGLLMLGAAYAVRILVLRHAGLDAAGFYQSAWTLGGLYVGFILQAMGTDFYPRLVGVIEDHATCNRVVNEQAHVSLLLAGPGVLGTLAFTPLIIHVFYTAAFVQAVEVLRWICLGMALRVVIWPIGYVIVAKNRQTLFLLTEVAWTLANVGLAWLCIRRFGLAGAGMAFFLAYVLHGLLVYPAVRKLTGFRWTASNRQAVLMFGAAIALVFSGFHVLPEMWATGLGMVMTLACSLYSLRALTTLVSPDDIPRPVRRLLGGFGMLQASPK